MTNCAWARRARSAQSVLQTREPFAVSCHCLAIEEQIDFVAGFGVDQPATFAHTRVSLPRPQKLHQPKRAGFAGDATNERIGIVWKEKIGNDDSHGLSLERHCTPGQQVGQRRGALERKRCQVIERIGPE